MSEDFPRRLDHMPNAALDAVVRHARRTASYPNRSSQTDSELLAQFVQSHDPTAFEAIVSRHAAGVMGTCLRVLRHRQDAEDAFQATFMVLARRANHVAWKGSIAGWLHEVAHRVSLKARGARARRNREAAVVTTDPVSPELPPADGNDWIDAEIRRLPRVYGEVVVLCCVEERSTAEAAQCLGVSEGSVRARLYRGREMLRSRLALRGVVLPGSLAVGVSSSLIENTALAAVAYSTGAIAGATATLADGAIRSMFMGKLKSLCVAVAAIGLSLGGIGIWTLHAAQPVPGNATPPPIAKANDDKESSKPADRPGPGAIDPFRDAELRKNRTDGRIEAVDIGKRTILVNCEIDDQHRDVTFLVANDAKIEVCDAPATLAEVKSKMRADMILSPDRTTIIAARISWGSFRAQVKGIDDAKRTATILFEANGTEVELPLPLRKDGTVRVDGMPSSLGDLVVGREYDFHWTLDKKGLTRIEGKSPADELHATFKSVDATKKSILVILQINGHRDDRTVEVAFDLASDVKVRFAGADAKLADLGPKCALRLKLADDRKTVTAIWAATAEPSDDDDD